MAYRKSLLTIDQVRYWVCAEFWNGQPYVRVAQAARHFGSTVTILENRFYELRRQGLLDKSCVGGPWIPGPRFPK